LSLSAHFRSDGRPYQCRDTCSGHEKLKELRNHVAEKIGAIAKPANIVFTPELPKTRSGKIMRRLLRDVANDRQLGDTTTLADPAVVSEIAKRATEEKSQEEG
jgi:acetyl-CoA synthetase